MPSFDIVRHHKAGESFRVQSVIGKFDLQSSEVVERFKGEIELPESWNVGLIVGASGTGKTTIAKELFPAAYFDGYKYTHSSVIDDMPEHAKMNEVTRMLSSVGFSSPPSWLKPYSVLSNGQKMRVDMARSLLMDEPLVVFDEFTSVVDRQVAQVGSYAVQKAVRKLERQFIGVGCHYDVEDWLMPDWVFDTNSMTFRQGAKKKGQTLGLKYSRQEIKAFGKCLHDTTI